MFGIPLFYASLKMSVRNWVSYFDTLGVEKTNFNLAPNSTSGVQKITRIKNGALFFRFIPFLVNNSLNIGQQRISFFNEVPKALVFGISQGVEDFDWRPFHVRDLGSSPVVIFVVKFCDCRSYKQWVSNFDVVFFQKSSEFIHQCFQLNRFWKSGEMFCVCLDVWIGTIRLTGCKDRQETKFYRELRVQEYHTTGIIVALVQLWWQIWWWDRLLFNQGHFVKLLPY